jgi:hypothetical protein
MMEREIQRMGSFTDTCWLKRGKLYRVRGYYTGDFIGECVSIDRHVAVFEITDTLRPAPRIPKPKCPFPGCVRAEFHIEDHELARMRVGGKIEVFWRNAEFVPFQPEVAA